MYYYTTYTATDSGDHQFRRWRLKRWRKGQRGRSGQGGDGNIYWAVPSNQSTTSQWNYQQQPPATTEVCTEEYTTATAASHPTRKPVLRAAVVLCLCQINIRICVYALYYFESRKSLCQSKFENIPWLLPHIILSSIRRRRMSTGTAAVHCIDVYWCCSWNYKSGGRGSGNVCTYFSSNSFHFIIRRNWIESNGKGAPESRRLWWWRR